MTDLLNYISLAISIILSIGVPLGGLIAIRKGYVKKSDELQKEFDKLQDKTINALKTRIEMLESQAESDTKEIARLRQLFNTVRHAFKRRGITIEVDGDMVTIIDSDGRSRSTISIHDVTPKVRRLKPNLKNDDDTEVI